MNGRTSDIEFVFIAKAEGSSLPSASCSPSCACSALGCVQRRGVFFWATAGRGVARCVWEQAAWSEWATADEHAVASILYDLLKAFDHVAYQRLIDAAVRTSFPLRQLRQSVQLFRGDRRVVLSSLAGEQMRAQRDILPGCAFGTTSSCYWWNFCERCALHIPQCKYDLSLQCCGNHDRVAQELEQASTSAWLPRSRRQNAKWPSR